MCCRVLSSNPGHHASSTSPLVPKCLQMLPDTEGGGISLVESHYFFFKFLNVTFERERVQVREGQRERETESEAGSRLRAVSPEPDAGFEPTNREIMT